MPSVATRTPRGVSRRWSQDNSTMINGRSAEEEIELGGDEDIRFGEYTFQFQLPLEVGRRQNASADKVARIATANPTFDSVEESTLTLLHAEIAFLSPPWSTRP